MNNLGIVTKALVLSAALAFAGCSGADGGGAAEPGPQPTTDGEGGHMMGGEHEHGDGMDEAHEHAFTPAMDAFHSAMAPLWHAEQGESRAEDTCDKIEEFRTLGAGLLDEGAPEGVEAMDWEEAVGNLGRAVAGLEAACGTEDLEQFQAGFQGVHDAFHALMAAAGMDN